MRNISIVLLGILGGISAVLIGVGELFFWMISFSSSSKISATLRVQKSPRAWAF